ncbi:chitin binding domain-containing protein [Tribonema minus]|uniref:Chitin binding domain-containing protein n=1 Tax=Tribonema minus TaxID=303371 RepID=A0A836C6M9_9STRA|nr:chitin binding domain-containing protein [Tribonema minus]
MSRTSSPGLGLALLCLLLQGNGPALVDAHGFVTEPASRNAVAYAAGLDWDAPGMNAKPLMDQWRLTNTFFPLKIDTTKAAKPLVEVKSPSTGRHLACGDPNQIRSINNNQYSLSNSNFKVQKTYSGKTMDITVVLKTHHEGHFEFFLCDVGSSGTVTQECFEKTPLVRADDGYSDPYSLVDKQYPGRYYIGAFCKGQAEYTYKMRYKLPAMQCAHCVLQWHYITANSCFVPGYRAFDKVWQGCSPKQGSRYATNEECGERSRSEEFWNCSDIAILNNGMCGYGVRGNGTCATKGQCCDSNGYCKKCARQLHYAAAAADDDAMTTNVEVQPQLHHGNGVESPPVLSDLL